jgi:hypothetical protein
MVRRMSCDPDHRAALYGKRVGKRMEKCPALISESQEVRTNKHAVLPPRIRPGPPIGLSASLA